MKNSMAFSYPTIMNKNDSVNDEREAVMKTITELGIITK